jgi:redox-sensitive bicupin YhaK (pirin superfamily)
MSAYPDSEPACTRSTEPGALLEISAHVRDLGDGFTVRRLLPSLEAKLVGPFIFFDHMGPVGMPAGAGLDVRPHPHLNLATVTYLFEGEILHRDSLGTEQLIRPGAVNWMTAGRGIVHSERSPGSERRIGPRVHGLQLWVALPTVSEQVEPSFQHHAAKDIPELGVNGARLRVIAGEAYGQSSPVKVYSPLSYVDAALEKDAHLELEQTFAHRAVYVVEGAISLSGKEHRPGTMVVMGRRNPQRLTALKPSRVVLIAGAALDGERYIWWNFVSSSRERIEEAKQAWRERRFPTVPGDDEEFIPLPPDLGRPR